MLVKVLKEAGYEEAILGFSLSYNTDLLRAETLLTKFAFGIPGENKFLESMVVWLDVTAPRYWWQEADTYRVGSTKQSESTMHTIMKRELTQDDFEVGIPWFQLEYINSLIKDYSKKNAHVEHPVLFRWLKACLPEGFLQRRIWCINYKSLQNIFIQRVNHRLPEWKYFCNELLIQLEHPEFIKRVVIVE